MEERRKRKLPPRPPFMPLKERWVRFPDIDNICSANKIEFVTVILWLQ